MRSAARLATFSGLRFDIWLDVLTILRLVGMTPVQHLSNHQCTRFELHSGRLGSLSLIDHLLHRMDWEALLDPFPPLNGAAPDIAFARCAM